MSVVAVAVGLPGGRCHRKRKRSPNSEPNLRDNSRKDALKMLLEVKNFTEDEDRQASRLEIRDLKRKSLWDGLIAKNLM